VLLKVRDVKLDRLDKYGADLPKALDRIVRASLRKNPRERFATAAEFRDELADYLFSTGQRVGASDLRAFTGYAVRHQPRRRRAVVAGGAAHGDAEGGAPRSAAEAVAAAANGRRARPPRPVGAARRRSPRSPTREGGRGVGRAHRRDRARTEPRQLARRGDQRRALVGARLHAGVAAG
jgi:hypothetical protein